MVKTSPSSSAVTNQNHHAQEERDHGHHSLQSPRPFLQKVCSKRQKCETAIMHCSVNFAALGSSDGLFPSFDTMPGTMSTFTDWIRRHRMSNDCDVAQCT
jgi:hypothetical protein